MAAVWVHGGAKHVQPEQARQTLLALGTATTGSGQERGCKVGHPYLSHHHQAQLQTLHAPKGSTALGKQLQTYDSISFSCTLARSVSGVAKNLEITLKLV